MSSQGLELISVFQVVWLPSKAPPTTEFLNSSRPACRPGDVLSPWSLAEQSFLVSTGGHEGPGHHILSPNTQGCLDLQPCLGQDANPNFLEGCCQQPPPDIMGRKLGHS